MRKLIAIIVCTVFAAIIVIASISVYTYKRDLNMMHSDYRIASNEDGINGLRDSIVEASPSARKFIKKDGAWIWGPVAVVVLIWTFIKKRSKNGRE